MIKIFNGDNVVYLSFPTQRTSLVCVRKGFWNRLLWILISKRKGKNIV